MLKPGLESSVIPPNIINYFTHFIDVENQTLEYKVEPALIQIFLQSETFKNAKYLLNLILLLNTFYYSYYIFWAKNDN